MKLSSKTALLVFVISLLDGCATIVYRQQLASENDAISGSGNRKFAIFFDGTHNDIASDTNVKKLHSIIALQNRRDISTLYIEGVGVENDISGMMTGTGFGSRVQLAYKFILDNYKDGDEIYLFGFSRGAYQARVLTSMLYYVGLPHSKFQALTIKSCKSLSDTKTLSKQLYKEMKAELSENTRTANASHEIRTMRNECGFKTYTVKVLGLWDTVAALGLPEWPARLLHQTHLNAFDVNVDEPHTYYGDQLHNVENAFHAMSIDDNREWIFTPLPLTRKHLLETLTLSFTKSSAKPAQLNLHEVWFAGAHSDVGGGYPDSELSGVSLNWMLNRLKPFNLFTITQVREDTMGSSHDPESGWWGLLYHDMKRNIAGYALSDQSTLRTINKDGSVESSICVHPSVFERRKLAYPKAHENHYLKLNNTGKFEVYESNEFASPAIYLDSCNEGNCHTQAISKSYINVLVWDETSNQCIFRSP